MDHLLRIICYCYAVHIFFGLLFSISMYIYSDPTEYNSDELPEEESYDTLDNIVYRIKLVLYYFLDAAYKLIIFPLFWIFIVLILQAQKKNK